MKNNKEKIYLSILILFQILFWGYKIFITPNKNVSTLNNSYNYESKEDKEIKENTSIPISNQLSNREIIYEEAPFQNNISNEEYIDEVVNNEISEANSIKVLLTDTYIKELATIDYTIRQGDTISEILREYEDTCNYTTGYKYLKLLNPNINLNEVKINTVIKIPYDTFSYGKLYLIKKGDTWYKLIKENYPEYSVDNFSKFLIDINDLPNYDLPLDEKIFLPKI